MTSHTDPTFRSYKPQEAVEYGKARTSYPLHLYNHILHYHERTNGKFEHLLDVGCGPGNATRDLSPKFDHAAGVDPGEEMINTAKGLGGTSKNGEDIQFAVCAAEKCASAPGVERANVDLLVAAMAVSRGNRAVSKVRSGEYMAEFIQAHWFDMKKFWEEAGKAVKPGGTVALWTISSMYAHPETPNAAEVNRVLLHFEREVLAPYEAVGNRISRDMYDNLDMPWTVTPSQKAFLREDFNKDEWDREGILTDGRNFFGHTEETSLERLETGLGTASMVTRWRAAHPNLVGTDEDCVKQLIAALRPLLPDGKFKSCGSTAILLFKRSSVRDN